MNCDCKIIADLLPLYVDGVCSDASTKAVEQHLSQCDGCRELLAKLKHDMGSPSQNPDTVTALKAIKHRLARRETIAAVLAVAIFAAVLALIVAGLKQTTMTVEYTANMSVDVVDGDMVVKLKGDTYSTASSKLVQTEDGTALYLCFTQTVWDSLTTPKNSYADYVAVYNGYALPDRIYYYTGDFSGLEELSNTELKGIDAQLIWEGV